MILAVFEPGDAVTRMAELVALTRRAFQRMRRLRRFYDVTLTQLLA